MTEHLTMEAVQLIADGESQTSDHVRTCARCASAIVDAVQLKRAVRDAMQVERFPGRIRAGQPPRLSWWLAAAAAILVGVIALVAFPRPSALNELADMHATILASANPVDVISTDKHTVKPWFEGRVPFAVPVPDLASTPFHLIGGRVVFWRGNSVAYLLVGKGAHRISVFVAPQNLSGTSPRAVSTLRWQRGGLDFVAVGDVPESDLALLRDAFNS